MSDWRKTKKGCPQGSNFGPLMWNIFQNDLMYNIQTDKCSVMMYADDHQAYTFGERIEDVESILNYEGKEISNWHKDDLLMCNHEKFQSMSLGSKHKNKQMKIDVMNNDIESHSEMKLLGVTIDEHLNFSRHIGEVCKNASRKVGVLMRLRNMLTTSAKLKIFISFIMPQITYCHTVWHFCRASDSRKMERVQERALRAVYCDTRSSYDELLRKAKLTTLGCRRLQDIAIIMYKVKYNICPPYIKDIFKLD